ncbi:cytochrome p450 [Moniliophthora roreri]|nr:cytochrome p450 [Moniliophthora roreri]
MSFFRRNPALPPGPSPLPLLGNVFDMPSGQEWLTFAEWGRKYGGICSVTLMGQPMIIINSADIMAELDKKSAIYSDRPRLEMGGELVGYSKTLVLVPYGDRFRNYRRYISRLIGTPKAMSKFYPMEEVEMHRFLQRVAHNPDDLSQHLRKTSGAIIMKLAYGIDVLEKDDPFVELIEHANDNFNIATAPDKLSEEEIFEIKHTAASLYGAGADTTVSAQYAFFLAMVRHPEVQRKAQAEIDAVAGNDRLPSFGDKEHLPYVNAVLSEALRWNSVAPTGRDLHSSSALSILTIETIGVPHRATEDGMIGGYFIPKGSIIITNLWYMLNDPAVYPDPFKFDPERFIATPEKPAQRDPRHACFGYARRICVGLHLAEASLWLCIVMSLAVFDISPAVGEDGKPIIPEHENTNGTISHPKAFKCTIKPRSEKALSLINGDVSQ